MIDDWLHSYTEAAEDWEIHFTGVEDAEGLAEIVSGLVPGITSSLIRGAVEGILSAVEEDSAEDDYLLMPSSREESLYIRYYVDVGRFGLSQSFARLQYGQRIPRSVVLRRMSDYGRWLNG